MKPAALDLPAVLLPYQQKSILLTTTADITIIEKSRRIGLTWALAADAVLRAASTKSGGGMDVMYLSVNLSLAREFIDACAEWARKFNSAAKEVEEFLFKDDNEREIQALRINFNSGFEIVALSSSPRGMRGRQGFVIIDEAAFHDDLEELMKAANAMLIWGGKVVLVSTHNGADNKFNEYVQDCRAGKLPWATLRIDLDDALRDGFYKRICLVKGKEWTQELEDEWREKLIKTYGAGADEELFCQPRHGGGAFLPRILVESRMVDAPVLRLTLKDEFLHSAPELRISFIREWCRENLGPLLEKLNPDLQHFIGGDVARTGDLTSFMPLVLEKNLTRRVPFAVELKNVPFREQLQILWYIMDALPRFTAGAFDARGNGSQMAEETMTRYGQNRIHRVMATQEWYLDAFSKYKAAFQDGTILLPRDTDILDDHRTAVLVRGIPQIPAKRAKGVDGNKRHGDSLISGAMAFWSSLQEIVEYAYDAVKRAPVNSDGRMKMRVEDFEDEDIKPSVAGHGFRRGETW
ncbi:MAG: hypothetical protein FJX23_03100 [Alphaproteobacteria bacterium]|nr:hypothetical protein [Alphaproteobacteria bacterium]